jgi:glycosyltransferase involved in cell wall biosynthesis
VKLARRHRLKPFLDAGLYATAASARDRHRRDMARQLALDPQLPWLLAVGMMRHGDKLASYRILGEALTPLLDRPWQLLVVGDGVARPQVAAALAPLGARVLYAGERTEYDLPAIYAAADISVWPAINEAYGVSLMESQAAGLPVVAGDSSGVGEIVADTRTGLLTPPGDVAAFAGAVAAILGDPALRARFRTAALAKISAEHDIGAASQALDRILKAAVAEMAP